MAFEEGKAGFYGRVFQKQPVAGFDDDSLIGVLHGSIETYSEAFNLTIRCLTLNDHAAGTNRDVAV